MYKDYGSLTALAAHARMAVTAHRGDSWNHPENTLRSMRQAIAAGCDFIEFDLRSTSDDIPVLLHDETVDRTSDGKGRPEEHTLTELKKLNFAWSIRFERLQEPAGREEIPTFREVLSSCRGRVGMNIQVYLKKPAALREACRLYRQFDMYDQGYFTIADLAMVAAVRAVDPDIGICFTPGWNERALPENLHRCAELGCRFVQPVYESVTSETFELCRELGLRDNVFFADTEDRLARLRTDGASGVMTNRPVDVIRMLANGIG